MKVLKSKNQNADQSLGQALKALGKLVNFVPSSVQPYPGVKVMVKALAKLNSIAEAIKVMYEDPLQD